MSSPTLKALGFLVSFKKSWKSAKSIHYENKESVVKVKLFIMKFEVWIFTNFSWNEVLGDLVILFRWI